MSLLNKMLNDLEKRQATSEVGRPLSENILLHAPARRAYNGSMLLFLLVAVAAGVAVFAWINHQKHSAPVLQVGAANSLPKTSLAPVKTALFTGNLPSPTPATQAAPEAVSKPAEPSAMTLQTAKQDAVRHELVRTQATKSGPPAKAKTGGEKAATKQVARVMKNTDKDSAKAFEQDKPLPKPIIDHASSFKVVRPQQQSDNLYLQAISLMEQSRATESQHVLRQSLDANPANYKARQLLAELLVDTGNKTEAAALLREGLDIAPGHTSFSIALANLQVANGAKKEALSTLEQGLPTSGDDAEYHALLAALLQNQERHTEAIQHYITALRSNPSMPNWLIGVGISLQSENKMGDAAEAFQRAIDTGELSLEVAQFADQRLKQIRQQP